MNIRRKLPGAAYSLHNLKWKTEQTRRPRAEVISPAVELEPVVAPALRSVAAIVVVAALLPLLELAAPAVAVTAALVVPVPRLVAAECWQPEQLAPPQGPQVAPGFQAGLR